MLNNKEYFTIGQTRQATREFMDLELLSIGFKIDKSSKADSIARFISSPIKELEGQTHKSRTYRIKHLKTGFNMCNMYLKEAIGESEYNKLLKLYYDLREHEWVEAGYITSI